MELQGRKYYHCTFCDFKCNAESKLEQHVRKHTREKPFVCDQCNRGFSVKRSLNSHIMCVHHGIKPVYEKNYKCSLCPYATHNRTVIENHTRKHTAERPFVCQKPNCEYAAKSSRAFELLIRGKHSEERKHLCQFPNCGYRGKTPKALKEHHLTHSESKPFVCDVPECNFRAKRKDSLQKHKVGVHNGGYKPFACSTCRYRTPRKASLKLHEITHLKEKLIKCSSTGCTFSCKTNRHLKEHVQNRHADRAFKCDLKGCISTSTSRSKLELHKKFVHYEKVYQCPSCDYRAAVPSILQKHIVRHYASRRIPCPITGCAFTSKNREDLPKHMKHHKAHLDCPVEGCGNVGTSKLVLKRHLKIHDPTGRPFHCILCPRHYLSRSHLKRHLKVHTKEKPFQCPVCNYGTTVRQHITTHVRARHSYLFPEFVCDDKFICNHCNVNFGSTIGLAIHAIKLKNAVVMLTRLQLKFDT